MTFYRIVIIISFLFFSILNWGQTHDLSGIVVADGNVEGIHVINKSAYRYATTNPKGEFVIEAKVSDSLYFFVHTIYPKIYSRKCINDRSKFYKSLFR